MQDCPTPISACAQGAHVNLCGFGIDLPHEGSIHATFDDSIAVDTYQEKKHAPEQFSEAAYVIPETNLERYDWALHTPEDRGLP